MTEQLLASKGKPKIELPDKTLVGVEPTNKKPAKEVTTDTSKLPKPTGWRMLVLPFKMKEKTKGGILITDDVVERAQVASTCGLVLALGPVSYTHLTLPTKA